MYTNWGLAALSKLRNFEFFDKQNIRVANPNMGFALILVDSEEKK